MAGGREGVFKITSKAYDTVDLSILWKTLCVKLQCDDPTNTLFYNYLFGRKMQTKVGDKLSTQKAIVTGVPQGTTWSPLLFNLYISDLNT